jgi:integrase
MPERYRALVVLAAGTGLRHGEALGPELDAVDFLRRTLRVRQQLGVPARLPCRLWRFGCFRMNGVVPLTVEFVPRQRHRRQLLVAHLDPKRVAAAVQLRADP